MKKKLAALWCRIRGYHRSYPQLPPAMCAPSQWNAPAPIVWDSKDFVRGLPCITCGKEQPIVKVVTVRSGPYKWEG